MTTQSRNNKRRREDDIHCARIDRPGASLRIDTDGENNVPQVSTEGTYIIIHRVECARSGRYHQHHKPTTDYLDVPSLPKNANRMTCLQGRDRLANLENLFEDHGNLSFAVCKAYDCIEYHEEIKDSFERLPMPQMDDPIAFQVKPYFYVLREDAKPATPRTERLILSEDLKQSLKEFSVSTEAASGHEMREIYAMPGFWQNAANLAYPYLEFYHQRQRMTEHMDRQTMSVERSRIRELFKYLGHRLEPEYTAAEALFQRGRVTRKHWTRLFRPGAVVVTHENSQPTAYITPSFPTRNRHALRLKCWCWAFDGKFFRNEVVLDIPWPSDDDTVAITDLPVYPLQYAHAGLEAELRNRGEVFWACRSRKFVAYDVPLQGMEVQIANLRYMIDTTTYKLMHGTEDEEPAADRVDLDEDTMRVDNVPAEPFVLLLPATIRGYGFHNKKWNRLLVKHIRNIEWNKVAFNHRLVLREEKKELIRALISVHIGKSNAVKTDFMDGKGDGLIILLHGGPGTGKTLTAETVAEFAERPLYRVTCGDIGTDPESVEKYLDSVLFIGSTWGCVVLLDEADVFLEERTKNDMQRNALVSVFLRVLEYYDGILILTTNRIGTFDEAFKSRVQLALHYPPLNESGREEIWHNFMRSLKKANENVDYEGIEEKLHVLAKHTLNGRQIRNTISTARQLARYKKDQLRFTHINQALQVVDEFEKYVLEVHGHGDEEYARDMRHR